MALIKTMGPSVRNGTSAASGADRELQVAVVDDHLPLQEAWIDLLSRVTVPSFYQSYAWCAAWIAGGQSAGQSEDVAIVTVRAAGRLVLLWPLAFSRYGPVRVLHALAEPATQYCDLLVECSPQTDDWLDAAWAALATIPGVDALHLCNVRQDGPLARMLQNRSKPCSTGDISPFLRLGPGDKACARKRSGKSLNALRRHLKRLGEHGVVVLERVARADHLGTAMHALRLKQDWLRSRVTLSAGHDHPANRSAILTVAGQGLLTMWRLRVGSRIAAVEIGAMQDGYYHSMIQSYDAAFAAHSPGRLLFWLLFDDPASGIAIFDFLPRQQPHKAEWTDDAVALSNHLVVRSLGGHLYRAYVHYGKSSLKKLYAKLPRTARLMLLRRRKAVPDLLRS